MLEIAVLTVFPGAVAFAAAMDLFTMTIPNRISLVLFAAFLVLAPLVGLGGLADGRTHRRRACWCWRVGVLLFIPGWIGGGDAKLAAAVALWVGFENLLPFLSACAGGRPARAAFQHLPAPAASLPGRLPKDGRCACIVRRAAFPTASRSRPAPCSSTRRRVVRERRCLTAV